MTALRQVRAWFTGRGRHLGAAALVLAALAVGRVVTERMPDAGEVGARPIERVARIGQTAHLRIGDVTVAEVTGGKEWHSISDAKITNGIWLAATIDVVPSRRESGLGYAEVRDPEGHVWSIGRGTSTCNGTVAGIPLRCQILVELPHRPIPGAELVLRWNQVDPRWDDNAVVPLTLDRATVDRWAAATDPIDVPMATAGRP